MKYLRAFIIGRSDGQPPEDMVADGWVIRAPSDFDFLDVALSVQGPIITGWCSPNGVLVDHHLVMVGIDGYYEPKIGLPLKFLGAFQMGAQRMHVFREGEPRPPLIIGQN